MNQNFNWRISGSDSHVFWCLPLITLLESSMPRMKYWSIEQLNMRIHKFREGQIRLLWLQNLLGAQ